MRPLLWGFVGSPVGENWGTQWELQQGSILLELPSHVVDCSVAGLQVAHHRRRGVEMEEGKHQSIRDFCWYVYTCQGLMFHHFSFMVAPVRLAFHIVESGEYI
jgi:hypothetical protein